MRTLAMGSPTSSPGNGGLLSGIIMGVMAFWLFAQTTLNIAPDMQKAFRRDAGIALMFKVFMALVASVSIRLTMPTTGAGKQ